MIYLYIIQWFVLNKINKYFSIIYFNIKTIIIIFFYDFYVFNTIFYIKNK